MVKWFREQQQAVQMYDVKHGAEASKNDAYKKNGPAEQSTGPSSSSSSRVWPVLSVCRSRRRASVYGEDKQSQEDETLEHCLFASANTE